MSTRLTRLGFALSLGCGLWPASVAAMEAVAQRITEAGPALATLWPGFWPEEQPFLLYRGNGDCVLASNKSPERGFTPHPESPTLWRGRCEGSAFESHYLLGQRFGGVAAPAVRVDRGWGPAVVALSLLHGGFHEFQNQHFRHVPGTQLRFNMPTDRFLIELKLHEAALLIGALAEREAEVRAQRVGLALAIRARRLADMDAAAGPTEDYFMRIEGSAEWVGMSARRLFERGSDEAADLRKRWRMLKGTGGPTWERLLRWQSYHSGTAALSLLESEGAAWRESLVAGEAPWTLLAARFQPAGDFESALVEARRLNRWAGVPRMIDILARLEREAERALRRFERYRGPRLEILGRPRGFDIAFRAHRVHGIDGGSLVDSADALVVESAWLRIDARHSTFTETHRGSLVRLLLTAPLDSSACTAERCPEGAVLIGRDIEVRLLRPAGISREAEVLRLRALPAPDRPARQ